MAPVVAACGLQSTSSLVVARGLNCHEACRIFQTKTSVLVLQGEFLTTEPPGKPQINYFFLMIHAFCVQSKKSSSIFG